MLPYPDWLNPGDNAWQLVAATLVGLMSIPGIAVLYGGIVQKKWAVNTLLMAFTGFSLVLVVWVLWGFKMGFGQPLKLGPGILRAAVGIPHTILSSNNQQIAYIPLLDGTMASAFAMTEPQVASSDATNVQLSMTRDGNEYVLNGRKWFASNALHKNCKVMIVMGKTDPTAAPHRQQSMMVVPIDAPGVTVMRGLPVFGYQDREGHAEIDFKDVRVPLKDVLKGEGEGFAISQARLGPGRIHHCMRAIGMAERALELMCKRAQSRVTFGKPISENANIQDWIAEARIDIEMIRLLTLKAAYLMDTVGNKAAQTEIAAIKVAAPKVALTIVDRAIQVHGGGGVTDDFPLALAWAHLRTLRLADGPDEVHKRAIARQELRKYRDQPAAVQIAKVS